MPNVLALSIASATSLVLATGCATAPSHIGKWAYEDDQAYVGVAFESADKCMMVGAVKGHAGLGGHCSYVLREQVITITEVWDNSGIKERLPGKYELKYHPETDTLTINDN